MTTLTRLLLNMKKASSREVSFIYVSTLKETLSIYSAPRFFSSGESWLGLKKLHQLTSESSGSLRITLKDFDNNTYVAFYDQFQVRIIFCFSMVLVRDCPTLKAYFL